MKRNQFIALLSLFGLALTSAIDNHNSPLHLQTMASHDYSSSSSSGSGWIGFIAGPILFFCSFVMIWYNQKRAAIDARRLQLGRQICQDVDVTNQSSATSKDGQLIYANGNTVTSAIIIDPLSGVSSPNLIKIKREVQVLEWREKTRKQGEHNVTYYELEWVSENSPNQGQRYNDPGCWFINTETIYNQQVFLGGYNITKEVADKCSKTVGFTPNASIAQNIINKTGRRDRIPSPSGEYIYFSTGGQGQNYDPNGYQGGGNYGAGNQGPGTLRVRFLLCPTGPMSLVGQSSGNPGKNTSYTFTGFNIARYEGTENQTNGVPDCCCCFISQCYAQLLKPIEILLQVYEQHLTKDDIFDKSVQKSQCFTRGIRILAFVCMVAGICIFFSPITTLLGYIPLVGGLISGIVGFAIFLAAVIISIPLYLLMISISWLFFHPKIGIILLLIAGAITTLVLVLSSKNSNQDSSKMAHMAMMLRTFT